MGKFSSIIKNRLNSWDEISPEESLRLRSNLLMFSLSMSCLSIIPIVLITIDFGIGPALPTVAMVVISIVLFCRQLFNPKYSQSTATLFAIMGLSMGVFLIWTGGIEGTGPLWLHALPIIAAMAAPLSGTLIYDCTLMIIVMVLLNTPIRDLMSYTYLPAYRISIPLSLLFVITCSYMTELARHNTHKKLVVASMKLQNSAFTDPLTEIYNRRALKLHLGDMNEKRTGLAFAMMDLDHFKKVNDIYGHDVGDRVLSHVVKQTRENIPSDANLYRWGGEEFLLVLKTDNQDVLRSVLANLREKIETTPLVIEEGLRATIVVTVSIGGVCPDQDLTIGECIQLADMHLYEAKENGRNQVVVKRCDSEITAMQQRRSCAIETTCQNHSNATE